VGIGLSRVVVLLTLFLAPFHPHVEALGHPPPEGIEYRAIFERKLKEAPSAHLAIVRYYPEPDTRGKYVNYRISEWVYNSADNDHAKAVWAREIPKNGPPAIIRLFQRSTGMACASPLANAVFVAVPA